MLYVIIVLSDIMREIDLKKRKINYEKLKSFGFVNNLYSKNILNDEFKVVIKIEESKVLSYVIDNTFNDEFTNVDVNTTGEFIGNIKNNYDEVVNSFINECTLFDFNYHDQVKESISYINNKYNDEIEYLWDSSPDSGIFRNKKNNKWYAAILSVKENRISGDSEDVIFVIDLMYYKDRTYEVIDSNKIYPGYHMNKKSWITIKLDGSVENEFIYKYIDLSYELSINKR